MGNLSSINNIPQRIINTLYPEPQAISLTDSQVTAVIRDNVEELKSLIEHGAPLNGRDTRGNSLLHMAVLLNREKIFNLLLKLPHIDINILNKEKASPLVGAIYCGQFDFASKLLELRANISLADNLGYTPLHCAIRRGAAKLCEILIKAGSDINSQTKRGQTPLYLACYFGTSEIIHMLLYYSADVTIPNTSGCLPAMLEKINTVDLELDQILYDYTFDEHCCAMELRVLTSAMVTRWARFPKIISKVSKVVYDEKALLEFSDILIDVDPACLQLFLEKFDYVIKDMLCCCCILTRCLLALERKKHVSEVLIDVLFVLLETDFATEICRSYCVSFLPVSSLVHIFYSNNLCLGVLTEIVCCLLSYGVILTSSDLCVMYFFYGHCELFEVMLHMDIETPKQFIPCCMLCDHKVVEQSILPHFMYDINFTIDKFLRQPKAYLTMDLDILLQYFALPKVKEFFLADDELPNEIRKQIERLPTVPSLIELARDVTRSYIIKKFNVRNSSQFYTVLRMLPISTVYKKIISYELKLYC